MANILKGEGFRNAKNIPDASIPTSTVFTGDIDTAGGIRIDGTVKGKVSARGDVTIGADGVIEGSARACNVNVAGKIIGDVTASGSVKMLAGSKIVGDLAASCFAIEKGAYYKGKSLISDSNEQPMLSAPKSEVVKTETAKAKATESEKAKPEKTMPEEVEPETSESKSSESKTAESEENESETVESEAVETEIKQEAETKQDVVNTPAKRNKYRKR